ncbi:MAG: hypothetical protein ABW171_11360 [Steroidobacter sp.]
MNDDLKKMGIQLRQRTVEAEQPGRIAFDARGNAVYAWNEDQLSLEGEEGERARSKALEHPGLSMVDDEPKVDAPIRNNATGLRMGYNPYESGLLPQKETKKKTDLRELSKVIEMKRRAEENRSG